MDVLYIFHLNWVIDVLTGIKEMSVQTRFIKKNLNDIKTVARKYFKNILTIANRKNLGLYSHPLLL